MERYHQFSFPVRNVNDFDDTYSDEIASIYDILNTAKESTLLLDNLSLHSFYKFVHWNTIMQELQMRKEFFKK